jgi:hypothetical protein
MAINSTPAVSLPGGAQSVVFAGKSAAGDYVYPNALAAGNYLVVASNGTAICNIWAPTVKSAKIGITSTGSQQTIITVPSSESNLVLTASFPNSVAHGTGTSSNNGNVFTDGTGLFVSSGAANASPSYRYSTDAITWTTRNAFSAIGYSDYIDVYGSGYATGVTNKYVAGVNNSSAQSNTQKIATSTDGVTWTARTDSLSATNGATAPIINAAATVKYTFFGTQTAELTSSTDGVTWVKRTIPSVSLPVYGGATNGTASTNQIYVYGTGTSGTVITSTDGITWTSRSVGLTGGLGTVAYGAGLYLTGGGTSYATSTDGVTWTSRTSPVSLSSTIYFYNNLFQSLGQVTSTDGITWLGRNTYTATLGGKYYTTVSSNVTYSGPAYFAVYSLSNTTLN